MTILSRSVALAVLVATVHLPGRAYAEAPKASATESAQPAATAPKAAIATKAPLDWIMFEDTTYTPVVDDVSRHLDAARKAFDAEDNKTAAMEMRAVADQLKMQAERADKQDKAIVAADAALLAADKKAVQEASKGMSAGAQKASAAAAAIESGQIKTKADLDKAIDKAARADMDRRWLMTDVTTWYPIIEEPQRHFMDAAAAYAKKDYKAAATDIRKATSYLRLEAGRATGEAKHELETSVTQLETLAAAAEKGTVRDEQSMTKAFARADNALALEHRSKAAESVARKEYDKVGYELKAAAHGLESAATWTGEKAKSAASTTVADTRALADKLASGATWTRDEIAKALEVLGNSINTIGEQIGSGKKASPIHASAGDGMR